MIIKDFKELNYKIVILENHDENYVDYSKVEFVKRYSEKICNVCKSRFKPSNSKQIKCLNCRIIVTCNGCGIEFQGKIRGFKLGEKIISYHNRKCALTSKIGNIGICSNVNCVTRINDYVKKVLIVDTNGFCEDCHFERNSKGGKTTGRINSLKVGKFGLCSNVSCEDVGKQVEIVNINGFCVKCDRLLRKSTAEKIGKLNALKVGKIDVCSNPNCEDVGNEVEIINIYGYCLKCHNRARQDLGIILKLPEIWIKLGIDEPWSIIMYDEIGRFNEIPGVYALTRGNDVVYVGQSSNIFVRLKQHLYRRFSEENYKGNFDGFKVLEERIEEEGSILIPGTRRFIEGKYVEKFKPIGNLRKDGSFRG